MNLRSILSPVDFSDHSRLALRWAAAIATRFQSRLTVLSVVDTLLAEAARIRLGQDLAKTEAEPGLREFVAATWQNGNRPSVDVVVKTRIGHPATVILETAKSDAVDLIVMGTHGLGGFRKWLLGSTTERLLRQTHVPVLTVPPVTDESYVSSADGRLELSQILAATDFSKSSVRAVATAADLARQFSATLTLVHVVEPVTVPPQWMPLLEESDETRLAHARTRLEALAHEHCGSQACEAIVSVGRPADIIVSVAQDRRVQLIIMGLNSDQGRFAPRPGSIAYRVVCSTTAPVLVVPPPDN
jgi:nucleotide-binding universal stress UspA family protein